MPTQISNVAWSAGARREVIGVIVVVAPSRRTQKTQRPTSASSGVGHNFSHLLQYRFATRLKTHSTKRHRFPANCRELENAKRLNSISVADQQASQV
jgi:TnpA family transposase